MHVTLLLLPQFQMLAWVLATETLRIANKRAGQAVFSWQTLSATRAPVAASNGTTVVPNETTWPAQAGDLVLVCAGYEPLAALTPGLAAFLGRAGRQGAVLGGLDTGTVVLARLGLLSGHRAVIHSEAEAEFRDSFADVELSPELYCLTDTRLTAAGGIATADAMLAWIARVRSPDLAAEVAVDMAHGRIRAGEEPQRPAAVSDPALDRMQMLMRAHLSEPLPVAQIAHQCGLSPKVLRARTLEAFGMGPLVYYAHLRLGHAADLLRNTARPVGEIGLACGYATPAGFTRAFRARFGLTPRALRAATRPLRRG